MDWDAIDAGLIKSFQMSATNKGVIATDELTWSVPAYWRRWAFLPSGKVNVGRLSANSTVTFPIEVKALKRFRLPDDRAELRNVNDIIFVPRADDPAYDKGIDMIMIPDGNEVDQWYAKFKANGDADFYYSYAERTMYEFVYDGNQSFVDILTIPNSNLNSTETYTRRLASIPDAIPLDDHFRNSPGGNDANTMEIESNGLRNLVEIDIENPSDLLKAFGCEYCRAVSNKAF